MRTFNEFLKKDVYQMNPYFICEKWRLDMTDPSSTFHAKKILLLYSWKSTYVQQGTFSDSNDAIEQRLKNPIFMRKSQLSSLVAQLCTIKYIYPPILLCYNLHFLPEIDRLRKLITPTGTPWRLSLFRGKAAPKTTRPTVITNNAKEAEQNR